ncbi:FG-GAP-like repeat-containing protein [Methylobacterium tarhaniae]|uniref:FG-GAP-like repeat-containing protein n=1 Tax=Methylobacterium tarhaniae TaxID=1187852 RepID=UPI003CFE6536
MTLPMPNVTAITITPVSGTVGIGAQIVLTLSTDQPVTVSTAGGTPSLTLSNGATAAYTGVDGSGRPRFTYTVAAGDTGASNLTVTGLSLNGGSITGGGGSLSFGASTDLPTGGGSASVATADVDGDGKLDIVVTNSDVDTVSVLLGNGNGTFKSKTGLATGSGPYAVALADVNSDGRLDIVTANYRSATASVLLGNGNGTFETRADISTGSSPYSVALADVDSDGKLDIVTANYGDNTASVLLGNGNGTFKAEVLFGTGSAPRSVALADVNGDGRLDLVTANGDDNTASVLLGNGNGTFKIRTDLATGGAPRSVALADVNGDGRLDVVTANTDDGTVSVLLGNGNGTFKAKTDFGTGGRPRSVALADVDGDGKLDIVTANADDNTASVLLGNGDGTFKAKADFTTDSIPYSVALADLNGDGKLDLVTANNNFGTASVLLNTAAPGISLSTSSVASATGAATGLALDATRPTLVSATVSGASLVLTYSEALDAAHGPDPSAFTVRAGGSVVSVSGVAVDGAAKTVTLTLASPVTAGQSVTVAYADPTNGDDLSAIQDAAGNDAASLAATPTVNRTEARVTAITATPSSGSRGIGATVVLTLTTDIPVTVDTTGGTPSLSLGNGAAAAYTGVDGSGKPQFTYIVAAGDTDTSDLTVTGLSLNGGSITGGGLNFATKTDVTAGDGPYSVALADVNGDGKLDIVTANYGSNNASVLLGNGDGTFRAKTTFSTGSNPGSVALADLDGDGKLDIVTANSYGNSASVLRGNGDGTFKAKTNFTTGAQPFGIALGDVNGDGKLDLVTANFGSGANSASVLLGNGNGTFKPRTDLATGPSPASITLADVDGDHKLDIVTANYGSGASSASVLLGNGDGTFKPRTDFATGNQPNSVTLGDVNGDGRLDLVTANYGSNNASVLLGNGDGTFKARTDFTTGSLPTSVALADADGDGKLDLVTANYGSGASSASVLLGNGDGTFKARTDFTTGSFPASITLGDVDGDHKLDIVTANYGDSSGTTASVLLNATSPIVGLSAASVAGATGHATGLAIDATPPAIVTVSIPNAAMKIGDVVTATITVASDTDTDTLQSGTIAGYTLGGLTKINDTTYKATFTVTAGLDVAASADLPVSLVLEDGAGNLSTAYTTAISQGGDAIDTTRPTLVSATVDGASLVLTYSEALDGTNGPGPNAFTVREGGSVVSVSGVAVDGAAKTVTLTLASPVTAGQSVTVAYADPTNGDDLSAIQDSSGNDAVSLSATGVTNQTPIRVTGIAASPASGTAGIGAQIVLTLSTDLPVTVDATGGTPSLTLGNGATAAYTGVDADGKPQFTYMVAAGDTATSDLTVTGLALNGGTITGGGLSFASGTTLGTSSGSQSVSLADVNGDGKLDLVTANSDPSTASVLLGNGDGTFKAKTDFGTGSSPYSVALADLNGDGKLDLVTTNNDSGSASVLLGNGDGTFQAKADFGTGGSPIAVTLADVDGDGKRDIVTANYGNSVSVLLGNGDGTFKPKADATTGSGSRSAALADLDGDGKLDIVTANQFAGTASVLLGNGDGTFKPRTDIVTGRGSLSVKLADLDGDGRLDIVTANNDSGTVSVLLGNGDGTFRAKAEFSSGRSPYAVALADIDGDGQIDIVTANSGGASTSVLLGNGDGTFKDKVDFGTGRTPLAVALGDLDGDTKPDIVTAQIGGSASVLLNATAPIVGLSDTSLAGATGAATGLTVDATPPAITAVSIPNAAMKIGDVVTATITVASDADIDTLQSGTIAGYSLGDLTKVDDTTYKATFTVTAGTDVAASTDLPVSLVLEDGAGNASTAYTTAIRQGSDGIDATRPTLVSATVDGTALVLTYSEALDAIQGPAAGAFTVMAGGSALGVSGVAVDGAAKTVTLTLASPLVGSA